MGGKWSDWIESPEEKIEMVIYSTQTVIAERGSNKRVPSNWPGVNDTYSPIGVHNDPGPWPPPNDDWKFQIHSGGIWLCPTPDPLIPFEALTMFKNAMLTGFELGGSPFVGRWTDYGPIRGPGQGDPLLPGYIRSHTAYARNYTWLGLPGLNKFWWLPWLHFHIPQIVFSCSVEIKDTYPTDPNPNMGVYYESSTGTNLGWTDWDTFLDVSGAVDMAPQGYTVTFLPSNGLKWQQQEQGYYWDVGPISGFFSNDTWPLPSDGTFLCRIEAPETCGEYETITTPAIIPLSESPGIAGDFTLLFTPDAVNTLPATSLAAPGCTNYAPWPGGHPIRSEAEHHIAQSIRTYDEMHFPHIRFQPPRRKEWIESYGVPPLRQRARNDGLTTDTRQERRQSGPSSVVVPNWWIGAPGSPPEYGGST